MPNVCAFRDVMIEDFKIFPRTLEELDAVLNEADAQRNDPSKWISSIEFHTRLENKYPWLR